MASKHRLWAKVFAKSFAASTLVRVIDSSIQTQALANTQCEGAPSPRSPINPRARLSRKIEGSDHVEHHYKVDWKNPLGQGSFGIVYLGTDRVSQERVAVKKVSVKHQEIMDEVQTMAHVADTGGHPNICGLRDYFRDRWYHYLVVDLIEGYEMFDHLVSQGAYSEAEAARLMREVASALAYLHGLDVTHGDLKRKFTLLWHCSSVTIDFSPSPGQRRTLCSPRGIPAMLWSNSLTSDAPR